MTKAVSEILDELKDRILAAAIIGKTPLMTTDYALTQATSERGAGIVFGPVHIVVVENQPGHVDDLLIRMYNEDYTYDRYCAISDRSNKASQLQMFKSLVQMCKEIAGYVPPEDRSSYD